MLGRLPASHGAVALLCPACLASRHIVGFLLCRMAPELFPSVPGGMSGMNRKEAEDRVTEKVSGAVCTCLVAH
jgi:hypothetical protein